MTCALILDSGIDRTRGERRQRFCLFVPAVFLWGCIMPAEGEVAGDLFERHEITLGFEKRQSVMTGFLLEGDVADLAVVHIDREGARRVIIHAFEGQTWKPRLDATLRPGVTFVDVASIDGRDRLLTFEPEPSAQAHGRGRLSWFDPESGSEQMLVAVTTNFSPPLPGEVPHVDISRDVNGDGQDDLLLPTVDGFEVLVQTRGGAFADPVKVGPPSDLSRILGPDGYRYEPWGQSRVHQMDYDHDGRIDLVSWREGHFEVHRQDEQGHFDPVPRSFGTDVPFDSDRISSLAVGKMTGRVLHSIADYNGDGVGDLVVQVLEGKRVSSKRSSYEVHFGGRSADGGTAFGSKPGATFRSKGSVHFGLDRHDFDGDGQIDVLLTTIDVKFLENSLWKRLKGFMGDDVIMDLEFYRMQGGAYSDEPDTRHRIGLDGFPSHREPGAVPMDLALRGATHEKRRTQKIWPRAFNSPLLVGDVTGDGRLDLIRGGHPRLMEFHAGVPGSELFAKRSRSVSIAMPNDEEYIWLADLNKDGKQDLLMHHPFTLKDGHGARKRPLGTEAHRITVFIAR